MMVENRTYTKIVAYFLLAISMVVILFPVWMMVVAATHETARLNYGPMPFLLGDHLWENVAYVFSDEYDGPAIMPALLNSFIMAVIIAIGKICMALLSAFALVYFKFRWRMLWFWLIFFTMMVPVEIRIIPTYQLVAGFELLNSYAGLTLPLVASAMAVFLFRQTFLSVPEDMLESAKIDGAGPMRFFFDILLPMSRGNIAAMFVIVFVYGWNQYLWPLVITTDESMNTIVMSIKNLLHSVHSVPNWNIVMLVALLAMLPPVILVIIMQKQFIKGLTG